MNVKNDGLVLCLVGLLLFSCETVAQFDGKVVNINEQPITHAMVTIPNTPVTAITDSLGRFSIYYLGDYRLKSQLRVEMETYKSFELLVTHSENQVAYHVKREAEYVDFGRQVYFKGSRDSYVVGTSIELNSQQFSIGQDSITIVLDTMDMQGELATAIKGIEEYGL